MIITGLYKSVMKLGVRSSKLALFLWEEKKTQTVNIVCFPVTLLAAMLRNNTHTYTARCFALSTFSFSVLLLSDTPKGSHWHFVRNKTFRLCCSRIIINKKVV